MDMDMDVSPALLMDRVLQTRQGQTTQEAQILVMKKAMDMQESASAALLNAVAGDLPLANGGSMGTQVNTLV
ncbi:MAG: YjfB family protein [Hydrogenophaga sp.]|nr:YjfB family protein [Hydrogenophaga sp.]